MNPFALTCLLTAGVVIFSSCNENHPSDGANTPEDTMTNNQAASITRQKFGSIDNQEVMEYTLTNPSDMKVKIITYGGAVSGIIVPDKAGRPGDVVLGFDSLPGYEQEENRYMGAITGRYANRISKGKFTLDGKAYQLPLNNGPNSLHGGVHGFNRKIWNAEVIGDSSLKMSYTSKDGEEGYPGNCAVEVTYTLTPANELRIHYKATTDKPTPINLTNHSYFNLSAGVDSTVLGHEVMINADKYLEINNELIPTGKLVPVKGTSLDMNVPVAIGTDIAKVGGGYDFCYVLNKKEQGKPELAATVYEPASGRYMKVFTTEPGLQFYSGNFLDGTLTGKNGIKYVKHGAVCLEAQHFPDSPNHPDFPNTILRPGETFDQTTVYAFSTK